MQQRLQSYNIPPCNSNRALLPSSKSLTPPGYHCVSGYYVFPSPHTLLRPRTPHSLLRLFPRPVFFPLCFFLQPKLTLPRVYHFQYDRSHVHHLHPICLFLMRPYPLPSLQPSFPPRRLSRSAVSLYIHYFLSRLSVLLFVSINDPPRLLACHRLRLRESHCRCQSWLSVHLKPWMGPAHPSPLLFIVVRNRNMASRGVDSVTCDHCFLVCRAEKGVGDRLDVSTACERTLCNDDDDDDDDADDVVPEYITTIHQYTSSKGPL